MKTVTNRELLSMSMEPIKNAILRVIIRWQLDCKDRHLYSLNKSIENDQEAVRVITGKRALLASRLRDLL